MTKSITQMTKAELIQEVYRLRSTIGDLNYRIDVLEHMAVASRAEPVDSDTSAIIQSLLSRIKHLEGKTSE